MKPRMLLGAAALLALSSASLAQSTCYAENDGPVYIVDGKQPVATPFWRAFSWREVRRCR